MKQCRCLPESNDTRSRSCGDAFCIVGARGRRRGRGGGKRSMGQLQGLRIEGTRTRQDYKGCKGYRLVRKGWGCWGGGVLGGKRGDTPGKPRCSVTSKLPTSTPSSRALVAATAHKSPSCRAASISRRSCNMPYAYVHRRFTPSYKFVSCLGYRSHTWVFCECMRRARGGGAGAQRGVYNFFKSPGLHCHMA